MRISVALPSGAEGAGRARRALDALERETPAAALSTLELLVSEIISNSPAGFDGVETDWVLLEVHTSQTTIRTEITDIGADVVVVPEAGPSRVRVDGGWDLALFESLCSRWGVIEGENDGVWFEIDRWTRGSPGPRG